MTEVIHVPWIEGESEDAYIERIRAAVKAKGIDPDSLELVSAGVSSDGPVDFTVDMKFGHHHAPGESSES